MVTVPISSVEFIVMAFDLIGKDAFTAEVPASTAVMDKFATCPVRPLLSATILAAMVITLEVPALTVKPPSRTTLCSEDKVLVFPIWAPSSSRRRMPSKEASSARPVRLAVTDFTVTSPSAEAVSTALTNGTRAADSGASVDAGWSAGEVTVKPDPTATTTGAAGVPGATGVPGAAGAATTTELYFACESVPKYPAAGDTPLAACHAATADLVTPPKDPVAPPE